MIVNVQSPDSGLGKVAEPLSRQQPPSERDFELYLALVAESLSTRAAAARFGISQTRVLQVRDRVADWLGMHPPPLARFAPHVRMRVLGEAARLRVDHLLAKASESWEASKGTTTKTRSSSRFEDITTTTTSHGDVRYLLLSLQLNLGSVKLQRAIEEGAIRLQSLASGQEHREGDACGAADNGGHLPSPEGECSRDAAPPEPAPVSLEAHDVANAETAKVCDGLAARRREFLAALEDNTTPVQPPRTDAGGMLLDEADEDAAEDELAVLPLAAGAQRLAESSQSSSLTHWVSTGRPLTRKERRARKRLLAKLKRKAR